MRARDDNVPRDVGYWIRGSATRRGYATAAVAALIVHAFDRRGLDRVTAHCDVANTVSAAFARSIGFRELGEGTIRRPDGTPRPVVRFEMTRDSYVHHSAAILRERGRSVRIDLETTTIPPTEPPPEAGTEPGPPDAPDR